MALVAAAVAAADTSTNRSTSLKSLPKVHGVNYGSRFIVEKFFGLWGTDDVLFKGISSGQPGADASLCDVGTASDAGTRMSTFLDGNIREEHFQKMASLGFNTVRLPLGYWNLIDLPDSATPNGPDAVADRWRRLQNILPASGYRKWIDQVFDYASAHGLKIMLDLHGAPGAQAGNAFSGCDVGGDSVYYWETDWNKQLSVQAVEAMARICGEKGSTCWGLELLNEPFGYNHQGLSRDSLKAFYVDAIAAARKHIAMDVPVVIMDWPDWLASYWRSAAPATFSEAQHGKVVFSTHMYQWPNPPETDLSNAERLFNGNFNDADSFTSATGFELIFSESAMNSHGSGGSDDNFDYHGFAQWFVQQGDSKGAGSIVWNFDSYWAAWGPVNQQQVGNSFVDWSSIFAKDTVVV
jgi:aryl-phospho-beta-D-glucosidase BglC (GH1 family)